ncbi:hypothetical protein LY76DRAFT_319406 [Colletotrichum caudatum]|nr:hypothetical protein LY76DRAFT_319406 [Colletotrichum caudatum]
MMKRRRRRRRRGWEQDGKKAHKAHTLPVSRFLRFTIILFFLVLFCFIRWLALLLSPTKDVESTHAPIPIPLFVPLLLIVYPFLGLAICTPYCTWNCCMQEVRLTFLFQGNRGGSGGD